MSHRHSLNSVLVVATFAISFALLAYVLSGWYKPTVVLGELTVLFQWLGTAYIIAYVIVEFVRKMDIFTFLGLSAGAVLFALDLSRHSGLISQYDPTGIFEIIFGSIVFCDGFICSISGWLALNQTTTYGVIFSLLAVSAFPKLSLMKRR